MAEHVWYRHAQDCWRLGEVAQLRGEEIAIRDTEDGTEAVMPLTDPKTEHRNTHPCDPSHLQDTDDLALMNNLHEGPLLHLLRRRYLADKIYTFTGHILISINPYFLIPDLYKIPKGVSHATRLDKDRRPHPFTVAHAAYQAMREETNPARRNQSLIVSGESGAGKTEACKRIMQYLAHLSETFSHLVARRGSLAAQSGNIEKKVLDCNPFLEAFGNAMTVRNNNSSRFGKFLKIEYMNGAIVGATMRHYLLEKARVVSPQGGERNYHSFYLLLRGADSDRKDALGLDRPAEEFSYLSAGGVTRIDGVDDVEEYHIVCTALRDVGLPDVVTDMLWQALAGIAHLGDVSFIETGDDAAPKAAVAPAARAAVDWAAKLLGLPEVESGLITRKVKAPGQAAVTVPLSQQQARDTRDALAKSLYDRLFTWIIGRANDCVKSTEASNAFIGILDIFGFEIFENNSFEQLCINFANEKLQNLFNHHIFIMEQEQYEEEGVDVAAIEFINN